MEQELCLCNAEMESQHDIFDKIICMYSQSCLYSSRSCFVRKEEIVEASDRRSPVAVCEVGSLSSFHNDLSEVVDVHWRKRVCDWMYKIVDIYSYERVTVSIALSYLHRYLAKKLCERNMERCQLAALTSLYLAVKLHEPMSSIKSVRFFVKFSDGHFNESDLISMECDIMTTLNWLLFPPTPQVFAYYFIKILPEPIQIKYSAKLLEISMYILEMTMYVCELFTESPAALACAALVLAADGAHSHVFPLKDKCNFLYQLVELGVIEMATVGTLRDRIKTSLEESLGSMSILRNSVDADGMIYPNKHRVKNDSSQLYLNIITDS